MIGSDQVLDLFTVPGLVLDPFMGLGMVLVPATVPVPTMAPVQKVVPRKKTKTGREAAERAS